MPILPPSSEIHRHPRCTRPVDSETRVLQRTPPASRSPWMTTRWLRVKFWAGRYATESRSGVCEHPRRKQESRLEAVCLLDYRSHLVRRTHPLSAGALDRVSLGSLSMRLATTGY